VIWVERNSRAFFDEQGKLLRMIGMVADITERKRAEERLREYEKAVEGSEEMIAVVDREYRYLIANRKFVNLRNRTKEQVVGRLAEEVLNKGMFEAGVKEKLDECFRGSVVRYEMKYTYPELGERDVFVSYFPIEGANGIDRVACILQDITDRKRTEKALRKSEERFRLAAQAGKIYAYEWDVATDKVMRSEEHVNVLGFSDEAKELTRQQLLASVHPDDRTLFRSSVDHVTPENPATQISYRVLRPDGSVVWLEKSARALFDEQGKLLRMIGMVADITERKRAEEALRESEERLRLAVQAGRMYTFEWDTATDVIIRSSESANILQWSSDPTRDTNRQFIASVHLDDREAYTATKAGLTPEKPTYQITYRVSRPDGVVIWLEDTGRAFFDNQGRKMRVVGMVADVTDRKVAEEALVSVSRRLIEAQEQERTRIARELHDDFSQRLALLAVELEELHQNPPILSEIRRRMGGLHKQVSQIATDIQTLSHELHSSKLEYLGIAAAMRGFCKEFSEQQDVEIDLRSHDLPGSLSPDVSLCLFRVLQEALHNSAKHSGVRHFEVRLWGASSEIHLTVSDAGAGFDSEAAKESRGIGLISMKERVKLLKGTFSIESEPQRGTTVHARVPISSDSKPMRATG
jgi:PAS domain S-box-containing protein